MASKSPGFSGMISPFWVEQGLFSCGSRWNRVEKFHTEHDTFMEHQKSTKIYLSRCFCLRRSTLGFAHVLFDAVWKKSDPKWCFFLNGGFIMGSFIKITTNPSLEVPRLVCDFPSVSTPRRIEFNMLNLKYKSPTANEFGTSSGVKPWGPNVFQAPMIMC